MRNLKRALSLTLASVMLLGMMVVGSSAAGYPDVSEEENIEAIEVLQSVGVMEGDNNGNFNPDDYVTREQMAVIMSKLLNLDYNYYQGTNPFSDVPAWAAPYVAACAANGITSGIGGGMYGAGQNVNAVQAALMMLKALGYFQYQEDFGGDYVLATVKQATEARLFDGIDSNAQQALTRNEVAQMALNALKADMVTFTGDVGIELPNVGHVGYKSEYTARTSTLSKYQAIERRSSDVGGTNNLNRGQYYIQLGEELYNGDLRLNNDAIDDFGRPSRAWEYDGKAIGTYAKKELLKAEYTAAVTGEELYNLLTRNVINDYDLDVYVDGAAVDFDKNQLVRSNKDSIETSDSVIRGDITGRGVKTEVYTDPDAGSDGEIDIVIINTYLAKANADYNTKGETISLQVYDRPAGTPKRVDVEDIPAVEGMKEGDIVLVNWASDSTTASTKEVLILTDVPEVLTDVNVTKFKKSTDDYKTHTFEDEFVTKLTTGGNEYQDNFKAYYEDTTLGDYNGELLTNKTYDIFLDQYGYFIGARLHSGTDNYVFISAVEMGNSALGLHNSDALAIFADGTMDTIKVNVTDTNTNIAKVKADLTANKFSLMGTRGDKRGEFKQWDKNTKAVQRWYTYTENNGVYTLTPVTRYALNVPNAAVTVDTDKISLRGSACAVATGNAYGNDDSVYITTELTNADKGNKVVKEVTGTYTGVQSVRLTYGGGTLTNDWICAVYDKNNSIIAAVVVGEAEGSTDNYAYILGGVNSEAKPDADNDDYYWTFDAIMGGEKQTLTIKSRYSNTVNKLDPGKVQQLIFDAEGYVTTIKDLYDYAGIDTSNTNNDKVFGNAEYEANKTTPGTHYLGDYDVYHMEIKGAGANEKNGLRLTFSGNTLSIDNPNNTDDRGLAVMKDAKAVLKQTTNGKTTTEGGYTVQDAFNLLHDAQQNNNDFYFYGEIVAILNSSGRAEWVFFYDKTNMKSGNNPGYGTSNIVGNITSGNIIDYTIAEGNDEPTIDEVLNDIVKKFGWTWDSSVDSIDRLSNGNYSIVYSGRNYTVRMSRQASAPDYSNGAAVPATDAELPKTAAGAAAAAEAAGFDGDLEGVDGSYKPLTTADYRAYVEAVKNVSIETVVTDAAQGKTSIKVTGSILASHAFDGLYSWDIWNEAKEGIGDEPATDGGFPDTTGEAYRAVNSYYLILAVKAPEGFNAVSATGFGGFDAATQTCYVFRRLTVDSDLTLPEKTITWTDSDGHTIKSKVTVDISELTGMEASVYPEPDPAAGG